MAAGLFASLLGASTSTSTADSSSSVDPKHAHTKPSLGHHNAPPIGTPSHASQPHILSTSAQNKAMPDANASTSIPVPSLADPDSLKEAQDVADVDMELSSPPSSPPPSAPTTPRDASISLAASQSVKEDPSCSDSAKPASSESHPSTPLPALPPSTTRSGSSSTPTTQRTSRRRMMPARLSQVSSLLAGSMLEEELLSLEPTSSPSTLSFPHNATGSNLQSNAAGPSTSKARNGLAASPLATLTSSSIVVITSDPQLLARATFPNAPSSHDPTLPTDVQIKTESQDSPLSLSVATSPSKPDHTAGFLKSPSTPAKSSLVSTLAIKRQQLIETPDFKPRDDTLYMPKTRGLRSEAAEDTSDAAYERRHRKPETAEKRQRKAEVDRLSRDRQKLLARIEQLKTVEARMLQPIVIARDQVRAEASADQNESKPTASESKPLHERIEAVRSELLADAYETLKRYDLLLSTSDDVKTASPAPTALPTKSESATEKPLTASAQDLEARSQSPRLKIRIKGGRATWENADTASPSPKASPAPIDKSDGSRRVSARQPKHRVESLPTPLTAAAVEAVEDSRRKRRRLSATHADHPTPAQSKASSTHGRESPSKARANTAAVSPERRTRRRGSPEVGGTYKGKATLNEDNEASSARAHGRPQRAAAAAAAVASARQRLQYAERSFSDVDYEDEDEDEEVESALDDTDALSQRAKHEPSKRCTSHSLRRSPIKSRDHRSPSASSTSSSISSIASSLGYMYPTVPDTGSLKVSQSLAEIHASDPEATSSPVLASASVPNLDASPSRGDGARKRLKIVLSRSPSVTGLSGEAKTALTEALDSDSEQEGEQRDKGRPSGGALTESEAESILAAFLGTTPLGKSAKAAASAKPSASPTKPMLAAASTAALSTAPVPSAQSAAAAGTSPAAAASSKNVAPSKRRSTRRETTQSFGEKLPDLLTKTAQFDYSVMDYFRSIDRPGKTVEGEKEEDQE